MRRIEALSNKECEGTRSTQTGVGPRRSIQCSTGASTGSAGRLGRTRLLRVVLVAVCCLAAKCPVLFQHPLGPTSAGFIDQRLVGAWRCQDDTADQAPGVLTILNFDGFQYYIESVAHGEATGHLRAYATRIDGEPFLNLQEMGVEGKRDWMIARYEIPDDLHLSLRLVDPNPFQEVIDKPRQVRKLLERRRKMPGLTINWISCVKPQEGD